MSQNPFPPYLKYSVPKCQSLLWKTEVTLGFPGRKGLNTRIRSYTTTEQARAMKAREVNTAIHNMKNKGDGSQNGH